MKEAFCAGSAQYMEEYLKPPCLPVIFPRKDIWGGVVLVFLCWVFVVVAVVGGVVLMLPELCKGTLTESDFLCLTLISSG